MDSATLYDEDFYAWSEQQAAVLRRLFGRPDLPNDLDLEHVIEEVEDLGRSELNTVQSLLRQFFIHLMKLHALPTHEAVQHWREEAREFLDQSRDHYSRSMARRMELDRIWRRALGSFNDKFRDMLADSDFSTKFTWLTLRGCPFIIDDLMQEDLSIDALLKTLGNEL